MKFSTLIVVFVVVPASLAGRLGCDIPLSKTDDGFKFSASSSGYGREASYAKLDKPRGWCAKTEVMYREYLQVNLSRPRHIAAIETQGFKYSFRGFYVREFLVGYRLDEGKWKFYKSRSKSSGNPWTQKFVGNSDPLNSHRNEFNPSFLAKYVRIYPLKFYGGHCMKLELYGCNKTIDCTHVLKLNKNQKLNITSPSYPLPSASGLHCNWIIKLPKPNTKVTLVSLDFDVGGFNSSDNGALCKRTVQLYKALYSFSKYLVGTYCQSTNHVMPRVTEVSSEFIRIVFDVGEDAVKSHRGFNFIVWETHEDVKTAQACENSTISLDCRGHERNIQVTDVFYGQRQNSEICALNGTKTVPSKPRTSCRVQGVLPKLQSSCDYRNVCKITIERKTFPHDCTASGALEMFVVYQCNATERVVVPSSLPSVVSTYKPTTASEQIPATDEVATHNGVVTTTPSTPPPTTIPSTPAPAVTSKMTTDPVEEVITYHSQINASKSEKNIFTSPVVLIAVSAGAGFLFIVIIVVTCICLKKSRKGDEKAQVSKKGVVSLESLQRKEMVGSDNSLYEKIDDLEREIDNVRYEREPNKYSPLHGMSENPLYQRGESNNPYPSYDVPIAIGARGLHGAPGDNVLDISSSPSEPNYMANFKSPDELPSNSIPMAKYLEPPKSPPDFTSIIMPVDRNSESLGTPVTSSSAEEVYEAMGGSLA